jgi:hypothetical protein
VHKRSSDRIANLKNGRPLLEGPQQFLIDSCPRHLAGVIELGVAGPLHHLCGRLTVRTKRWKCALKCCESLTGRAAMERFWLKL